MKHTFLIPLLILLCACNQNSIKIQADTTYTNSTELLSQSKATDWRQTDPENTLYITLKSGVVIIELANTHAPNHVQNTKALVREGLFDNTRFYRVIDGFVAQGGPESPADLNQPEIGNLTINPEFSIQTKQPLNITQVHDNDGYADRVGFYKGFAAGQSKNGKENWLLHCYGALGMGRGDTIDSGGTELYVVIGHAQRYLDKNVTVFGRVIYGMEHLQALKRSTTLSDPVDVTDHNQIIKIEVASDMTSKELLPLEILRTDTSTFKQYIETRKNRKEAWFVDSKDYIDVCAIQVPTRLKTSQ